MSNTNLTKEEVKHVAKLARIGLTEEEIEKYSTQISSILEYIDKLNEIQTSDIEATSQVTGLKNILRKDEIKESLTQQEATSTAKNKQNGYFKTQAVIK